MWWWVRKRLSEARVTFKIQQRSRERLDNSRLLLWVSKKKQMGFSPGNCIARLVIISN